MDEKLQKKCDLLVSNREQIGKAALIQSDLVRTVAAYAYTDEDVEVNVGELKDALKLLKKKQGIFSEFRGNDEMIVATKMVLSGDPEKYIDDAIRVYKLFQKGRFFDSAYRVLAAMTICDAGKADEAEPIIERTNAIVGMMSKKHPFVAGDEAVCFAVLLTLIDKNEETVLEEIETSYKSLKKVFYDDAAYSLAQILSVYEGSSEQKCGKVMELFDSLRAQKAKYGKGHEVAILGTLVNVPVQKEELVNDIIETAEYLKDKKGFKMLDISKEQRLMIAGMIVSGVYGEESINKNGAIVGGTIAIVIAQQILMYLIIMSSTTAAIAASQH